MYSKNHVYIPNKKRLSRRTFLRGLIGGLGISIALPLLDVFVNTNGTAYANGNAFPKRFGLFYWGNGVHLDRWIPDSTGEGDDWNLSDQLAPLASVKEHLGVVTGMEVKIENNFAHGSGPGGFLSGQDIIIHNSESYTFGGPSLDQLIAAEVGGTTPFRSIEVAVQQEPSAIRGTSQGYSYLSSNTINTPESDPVLLFERLFGAGFRAPGEELIVDPSLALRRSILDAVMMDIEALNQQLGANDRIRLEQHLDGIRSLEQRIALLESEPPDYEACSRPEEPENIPNIDGRPQLSARSHIISDMAAMAMACDLTRVLSYWYCDEHNNMLFPGAEEGHHLLTHNEPGEQPMVDSIIKYIMSDFGYFIESLKSKQEGDGTLLDNSVILGTSGVSLGRTHRIDDIPILIAGTAGGAIRNNIHVRSSSQANASQVPFSLMKAMGMFPSSFGVGAGMVTQGLNSIET